MLVNTTMPPTEHEHTYICMNANIYESLLRCPWTGCAVCTIWWSRSATICRIFPAFFRTIITRSLHSFIQSHGLVRSWPFSRFFLRNFYICDMKAIRSSIQSTNNDNRRIRSPCNATKLFVWKMVWENRINWTVFDVPNIAKTQLLWGDQSIAVT